MKAIIMAGGEGSRLRPLTCDCPKPMLPLLGRPLMEYAVLLLKQHGICDIAATLGYLPEAVTAHFGDGSALGVSLRFYIETTPLGTAGSVKQARDFLDTPFIVLSGDGIMDLDLSAALRFHREKGALATLLLKKCAHPQEYGMVVTAPDGRVQSFHEKPGRSDVYSDLINTGVYILQPEVLARIPDGQAWDFGRDLFPVLLEKKLPVYGYAAEGYWCDVGDVAAYLRVHADALDGRIRLPGLAPSRSGNGPVPGCTIEPPVYIAPGARIAAGARIGAYSVIGEGCSVACGAGIKRSILLPGANIGPGAQLRGCIAGRNSAVGECAQLFEDSVVGSASRIGSRALLPPGVKVWPEKFIPEGERPDGNIVWGSRQEERFSGGALVLTSPAQASRAAQACMAELGCRDVLIGRAGGSVALALWHAAASGAMAQGVQAVNGGVCSLPQLRHALGEVKAGAALLVQADALLPLDSHGCPLSESRQRSILKLLERQDYACPFSRITPPMLETGNSSLGYCADVAACFRTDPRPAPRVALCSEGHTAELARAVLERIGLPFRMEPSPDQLRPGPGEIGLHLPSEGEEALFSDEHGPLNEVQQQLACAWTALQLGEERLILPIHHTRAIEALCPDARFLAGERALWLQALAGTAPRQFRLQQDGLYLAVNFISLMTEQGLSLDAWRKRMPIAWRSRRRVDLPESAGGRLLRALAREHRHAELGGGVRLSGEKGWAWLSPGEGGQLAFFTEAATMEAARELCDFYDGRIRSLLQQRD